MNRYFKNSDEKIDKIGNFEIPVEWWSRGYEYKFAMDFLKSKDTILDVGCGIEHPFKDYAVNKVKKVVAIDKDERITELKNKKIEYVHDDILTYKTEQKFDKIFVISTIEHTQTHIVHKLKNMRDLLEDKGRIIFTVDFPTLRPQKLMEYALKAKLKIDGDADYDNKEDIIHSKRYNLNCYSMVLKK